MNNLSEMNTFVSEKIIKANILNILSNMQDIRHPKDALKKEIDFSLHYQNLIELEQSLKSDSENYHIMRLKRLPQKKLMKMIKEFKEEFYKDSPFSKSA